MNQMADLSKWLLEKDIRAKNAASCLLALLSVVVFYFASRHSEWFRELDRYGAVGVGVALGVVFLSAFLATWLVYSGVAAYRHRVVSTRSAEQERILANQRAEQEADQQERLLRGNLDSLTTWQRGFLLRFIVEDRRQIPEFEVGQYKAAWDFEMAPLIAKRIVIYHRGGGGVYEIAPVYHAYVREHWNPQTGALE